MKRNWRSIAVLALLCAVIFAVPSINGAARASVSTEDCTLTVRFNQTGFEDFGPDDLVVDIYQLASVAVRGTTRTPTYIEPFSMMENDETPETYGERMLAIATSEGTPVLTGAPVNQRLTLAPGVYLIVARGVNITDPADYVTEIEDEDGNTKLVTIAEGERNEYHFSPVIVSIPTENEDGSLNFVVEVGLKAEEEPKTAPFTLIKSLTQMAPNGQSGHFVFHIYAELDGVVLHDETYELEFTAAGNQSIVIDDLPIGTVVTVTEVYQGTSYECVTDITQSVTVTADGLAEVYFENVPTDTIIKGGAITNYFSMTENGWSWTPLEGTVD